MVVLRPWWDVWVVDVNGVQSSWFARLLLGFYTKSTVISMCSPPETNSFGYNTHLSSLHPPAAPYLPPQQADAHIAPHFPL